MTTLAQLRKAARALQTPVEITATRYDSYWQVELWIESDDWVFNVNEAGTAIAEAKTMREAYRLALEDLRGGLRPRG